MKLDKKKLEFAMAKGFMTQDELKKKAKCSHITIKKGLTEDISPSVVGRIAQALGVEITEIIAD